MSLATLASSTKTEIQTTLSSWRGSLEEEQRALFKEFVANVVGRIRGPFLAQHTAKQVLQYLEIAFTFAMERPEVGPAVQLRRGHGRGLMVLTSMTDQPFIVDTVRLFLRKTDAEFWGGFTLQFEVVRNEAGRIVALSGEGAVSESLVMLEADGTNLFDDLANHTVTLRTHLLIAQAMVRDFKPMTRAVDRYVEKLEVKADRQPDQAETLRETAGFLRWLMSENFVFMGVESGEPLGIQSVPSEYLGSTEGDWPEPHAPGTVFVRKSTAESPVHRSGRIDEILVVEPGEQRKDGLLIRGMFTYRAVTQPCRNVPILRRVLAGILEVQESTPGSHRYKGIANVFDSLPTEFLFTASRRAIAETLDLVFESEQQQEVGVTFLMTGPFSAFCLVAMPKTRFSDELRRDLEGDIVSTLKATYSDHGIFVGRYDTVLLHYYLTGVKNPGEAALKKLTERIRNLATPWVSRLWHALATTYDDATADRLTETYGRAFPDSWERITSAAQAVRDIQHLESLSSNRPLVADVYPDDEGTLTLRLYEAVDVYLSDILPVLDNFGLVVIASSASRIEARTGRVYVDTFTLGGVENVGRAEVLERLPLLCEAVEAVFSGNVPDDRFNRLTLSGGLAWEEVEVMRSLVRYTRQLNLNISYSKMQELLLAYSARSAELIALFHARFNPDLEGDRDKATEAADAVVRETLRNTRAHDEDLLFSTLRSLVLATVRTNYYRTDRPLHYVSFKFECAKVEAMGPRRPLYEIFVHNRDVEGVHIRFGMVARGGLRWSDRDDYRTEVMGLATTQVVKNVVIVPVGAKGGFLLKDASRDPATRRAEADLHYQTFIRGLLDLTDNAVGGVITPPPRVVRHDGDDPYLVVAADKGTAHLSDTANAISKEYGFWLDDAFASGGSNGYDHKGVAITARGAWVLVRRHFAELGRDPYSETFTCAGIGDMGGDVFGNGLLETPHTELQAAFNHMHIFLDPTPDAASSFEERKRLFALGRGGGWEAYDTSKISQGGGVFVRSAKSIPLSPEAQAMLDLPVAEAAPELVIKHILKMKVDLLWNGGIGTYVKASTETHADADDRSNDAVRVDATELGCQIIGEGGNLGMTQRARIEAGLRGVHLNTDFIDNSGGVDMSDHEVNLKILLQSLVDAGTLTEEARNNTLREMTDEVATLVLRNNDAQGRQLSRDVVRSEADIFRFGRTIDFICKHFGRKRRELKLPSNAELTDRAERGEGLTRPELAVLSSWMKMFVFEALMAAEPKRIPGYKHLLHHYFPKHVQTTWPDAIDNHMLADEIAMTEATTRIVADAGVTFFPQAIEATGRGVRAIAAAYLKAQRLARADRVRTTLEELRTTVALRSLNQCWIEVDSGARRVASYWLSSQGKIPSDAKLDIMASRVDEVYELQASDVRASNADLIDRFAREDIPPEVAHLVLKAQILNVTLMVLADADTAEVNLQLMTVRHLAVARASRLGEVLEDLATRKATGHWEPLALQILQNRFTVLLRNLVLSTDVSGAPDASVDELVPWLEEGPLAGIRDQVDEFLDLDQLPAMSTLLVLEERLAGAVKRLGA